MTPAALLALQTLTTLGFAPPGPGLPPGWRLERVPGAAAPSFAVTPGHTLRITAAGAAGAAGLATYRLRTPLRPADGALVWNWRTTTPLRGAALHERGRDDYPVRVVVAFEDGRMLLYTWGNTEGRRDHFLTGGRPGRGVIVLERAEDADGSWHTERRDAFRDYRLLFDRAPKAIVAAGVGTDTHRLKGRATAEVGELSWEAGALP